MKKNSARGMHLQHKGSILLGILFLLLLGWKGLDHYASIQAKQLIIEDVPLTSCRDGVYIASYAMPPVQVTLELELKDHKIIAVTLLEHQNGWGGKAEGMLSEIVRRQSLQVDVISGASISSKCILKAAELACKEAMEDE